MRTELLAGFAAGVIPPVGMPGSKVALILVDGDPLGECHGLVAVARTCSAMLRHLAMTVAGRSLAPPLRAPSVRKRLASGLLVRTGTGLVLARGW